MEVITIKEALDHKNEERFRFRASPGLSEEVVRKISESKNEPEWMLQKRLQAFKIFQELKMPNWGPDLSNLDLNNIVFYQEPDASQSKSWEDVPADIRKTFELLGIPEAEKKYLAGVGAQYECLSGDSLVFTNPKGPVEIKDIKAGDNVFAFDEKDNKIKTAKVLGIKEKGKNHVYEVVVDNKKIKATANHPFLVLSHYKKEGKRRGRYRREWKLLKDLKKGDLIAIAKKLPYEGKPHKLIIPEIKKIVIGRNQFGSEYNLDVSHSYKKVVLPKETTRDLMWFFGVYLGDGFIKREKGRDKKRVQIAIPEEQAELRNEIMKVVKKLFDYEITIHDKFRININSTIIADFIEMNGFKGNANQKRIPEWIFQLPIEQRLSFLGGYTDSDGYATDERKSNMLIFRSSSKDLINDLRNLVIYCNFHPSKIHLIKSKHPLDKKRIMFSYQTEITGDLKDIDSRYSFKSKRLKEKKRYLTFTTAHGTVFRKHANEYIGFAKIESINPAGIEKVYDIEVEGFHNFIANGLIAHNSNVVYHNLQKDLQEKGVIFEDFDVAVQKYPELVKKYFMSQCVSPRLHKFAALHGAVFSGGTFIYVPKNVKVTMPLQAYFRMNAKRGGQFEHTLIIVDEGAEVHYIEGCSAPQYTENSLHAGCVEIFVHKNARARYSSVENWSKNTFNLNTKRAVVDENGVMEWINGNMGSCVTMLYPCTILRGKNSKVDHIGIAFAGKGQFQDVGAKVYHVAANTSSTIISKSISKDGGITVYRGLVKIPKGSKNVKSSVKCDALMIDDISKSDTIPYIEVNEKDSYLAHEATVGKISKQQLFYLMSRGLDEEQATQMIVSGFIEPITKQLPLEYAVELNRLIELEMEGSLG